MDLVRTKACPPRQVAYIRRVWPVIATGHMRFRLDPGSLGGAAHSPIPLSLAYRESDTGHRWALSNGVGDGRTRHGQEGATVRDAVLACVWHVLANDPCLRSESTEAVAKTENVPARGPFRATHLRTCGCDVLPHWWVIKPLGGARIVLEQSDLAPPSPESNIYRACKTESIVHLRELILQGKKRSSPVERLGSLDNASAPPLQTPLGTAEVQQPSQIVRAVHRNLLWERGRHFVKVHP
eukprot:scaffold1034_cov418-Prasinococcus_capsulatus_cf.AAC.11